MCSESVCVTDLSLRLDRRSLSFGTSHIALGLFINTKLRTTKDLRFVTYDPYNHWILALSHQFIWGLWCTHRVALVRLPLLTAFACAYYYAFRSFSVGGYARSMWYSRPDRLLRGISCSLRPAYVFTTPSLVCELIVISLGPHHSCCTKACSRRLLRFPRSWHCNLFSLYTRRIWIRGCLTIVCELKSRIEVIINS